MNSDTLLKKMENIGAGGFGFVRKAIWRGLGRGMYVAVKCFFVERAEEKGGFVEEVITQPSL